jgi:predicted XRE-type DNA-binding protein
MSFSQELLRQLQNWCGEERGRQVRVAKAVGVSRQRISDWFAQRSNPTAEQILAVQSFLKKQRRK